MPPDDTRLKPGTWWRSWPAVVSSAPDRARVEDSLPRLVMRDRDYRTVADYQPWPTNDLGFCMLEWDVALDRVGRARFARRAAEYPGKVLVADYPIYPVGGPPAGTCRIKGEPIAPGAPLAETFGLGCIYLPRNVLDHWFDERPGAPFTDRTFSQWHHAHYGPAWVCADVHPQHLHGD
jgi:hypothetical protein